MNVELKGLKGLRDLLTESKMDQSRTHLIYLSIDALVPGKYQPRIQFDDRLLNELSISIKQNGILQPIIVRKNDLCYEIIAGERRWRAAKQAGLLEVPAIIHQMEDKIALGFALIENIQRQNLNPLEEAAAYAKLQCEFSMSHQEIANLVGKSRANVTNTLRLLNLTDKIKELLQNAQLDMGHARTLLNLKENQQLDMAKQIIESSLSVRETEKLVKEYKKNQKSISSAPSDSNFYIDKKVKDMTSILNSKLQLPIEINLDEKSKGKIIIYISSIDEIEQIINQLD